MTLQTKHIYTFILLMFLASNALGQIFLSISGIVRDKYTYQFLPNTYIELLSKNGNNKEYRTSQKGQFVIDSLEINQTYKLRFHHSGYFDESADIQIVSDTLLNLVLCRIPMQSTYFPFVGFEFNQSFLNSDNKHSLSNLIEILESNPTMVLGVIGYTDSTEADTGIVLNRMNIVRNYLIDKGIDSNRLILKKSTTPNINIFDRARVYCCDGIDHDIITEEYLKTISDIKKREEIRSMNRWVWFKVLSDDYKK